MLLQQNSLQICRLHYITACQIRGHWIHVRPENARWTPLEELTALPRPMAGFRGAALWMERGKRVGRGKRKNLLLNYTL